MNLKPLTPSDYPKLKPFFRHQHYPLCGYSLVSILTWSNTEYHPLGAVVDGSVVICCEFNTKKEKRHMLLPVGGEKEYGPEQLADLAVRMGHSTYWFVPEEYIERYGETSVASVFDVTPQPGYNDYVYLAQDLMELKGNKYAKKRNLINQFSKEYIRDGRVGIEPITPASARACIDFLERWCAERECDVDPDENLACEKQAVIHTMEHLDVLEVEGILLKIDGEINAFGISSRVTDEMGALHFEKALAAIKGLYQYFDNQCAKRLLNGYTYINKESDMDIPGLAKAKKSYHPVRIVKSFRLTLR